MEQTTLLSHNLECHRPQATLATLPSHYLACHNCHHQLQEEVNEWEGGRTICNQEAALKPTFHLDIDGFHGVWLHFQRARVRVCV